MLLVKGLCTNNFELENKKSRQRCRLIAVGLFFSDLVNHH